MDDESHAPIAQSPPSSADEPEVPARRRFKKHSSCINCRRRKMKCDKIKPECGQCAYSKKLAGSCQYDSYKSQAQFLQDKVDELQAKIEELYTTQDQHPAPNSSSESESGNRPSTSALTRRPTPPQYYMAFSSPTSPRPYELGSFDDLATAYPAMEIFAPDSDVPRYTYTSPAHITPNNPNGLILRPAGDALRHAVAASRTRCPALIVGAKCQWWEYVELPACYRYHLIDIFLPHRYQAGLDFNVPRFLESLSLPEDQGPHPAYIDTMCLIACAFSRKPHLQKFEEKLLLQARHNLDQSLAQADRLLDFIRASSLLARYYGFRARFVEGYTTITACARFALACGLHKIASRVEINSDKWTTSPATLLAPPVDFIDLGDRINVFWMVFMLERTFASGKHLTSTFVDEEIDTLMPLPMSYYEMPRQILAGFPKHTIMSLYDLSTGAASVPHDNVHSMTVKSSVLLQRATDLKLRAEAKNLGDSFWTESLALENVILHFAASVPLVPSLGTEPGPAGGAVSGSLSLREASTIWINMLNLTALMQLHAAFALDDPVARQKCLSSLEKIIRLARLVEDSDPRYLQAVEIPLRLTHGFLCQIIDRCREDGDAEGLREYEPMQEFLVRVVTALAPNHILRRPPPTWSI